MRKTDTQVWAAFLQWVREEGARRGLTSTEAISRAAGIGTGTMSRWAHSKDGPSLGVLARVADAFGITVAELGAAFDHARNPEEVPPAEHHPWPSFEEIIEHATDLAPEEASMLRRTLAAVRAAKTGQTTTVIVT
jgi:transcriptional regulator with XRE-family HTH domain